MKRFNTVTELKIQILADHIYQFHGLNHRFTRKQLKEFLKKNQCNDSHLEALYISGCIERKGFGVYAMKYYRQDVAIKAYKDYLARQYANKDKRNAKQKEQTMGEPAKTSFVRHLETQLTITESSAIAYLKNKGYKIMKPTTTFEEI